MINFINWFKRKKPYPVSVNSHIFRFASRYGMEVGLSIELRSWLEENQVEYEIKHDKMTGKVWLDVFDKKKSIMCKLVFG